MARKKKEEPAVEPAADKKIDEPMPEPEHVIEKKAAYRVRAVPPKGYWKISRHFSAKKAVILLADSLSNEEKEELERSNPRHLSVEKIEV